MQKPMPAMFWCLVTLTFDPKINEFPRLMVDVPMSSIMIVAASVFDISYGKLIDRQTDTNYATEHPTHVTAVGVGN